MQAPIALLLLRIGAFIHDAAGIETQRQTAGIGRAQAKPETGNGVPLSVDSGATTA